VRRRRSLCLRPRPALVVVQAAVKRRKEGPFDIVDILVAQLFR
jgi:hypothetical protein